MNKCVFLDRDGTINIEKNYLHKIEEFEWEPGSFEAIKIIKALGYKIVVITNQSGIARGYYTEENVDTLHNYIQKELKKNNTEIDRFYFCPHYLGAPVEKYNRECYFRKPNIGYFEMAREEFDIDYMQSFMVGDRVTDLEPAVKLGIKPVFVKTGYGKKEVEKINFNCLVYENLFEFAKWLELEFRK